MSPERKQSLTAILPDSAAFPKELVDRVKQLGTKELPVFYFFRKLTGINVREGSDLEYVLSVISDMNPQINFVGHAKDRIYANQIDLLLSGIKTGYESGRWKNLNPNAPMNFPS